MRSFKLPSATYSPVKLLDGVSATGGGSAQRINPNRMIYGPIPVSVRGIVTATVKLQGCHVSVATPGTVNEPEVQKPDNAPAVGDPGWTDLVDGVWTENNGLALFAGYSYIRGYVSSWSSGVITMEATI